MISWLKRSLEAVKEAHLAEKTEDPQRKVHIADRAATVDGMYLSILVHANEHMGQLVAYVHDGWRAAVVEELEQAGLDCARQTA